MASEQIEGHSSVRRSQRFPTPTLSHDKRSPTPKCHKSLSTQQHRDQHSFSTGAARNRLRRSPGYTCSRQASRSLRRSPARKRSSRSQSIEKSCHRRSHSSSRHRSRQSSSMGRRRSQSTGRRHSSSNDKRGSHTRDRHRSSKQQKVIDFLKTISKFEMAKVTISQEMITQ